MGISACSLECGMIQFVLVKMIVPKIIKLNTLSFIVSVKLVSIAIFIIDFILSIKSLSWQSILFSFVLTILLFLIIIDSIDIIEFSDDTLYNLDI